MALKVLHIVQSLEPGGMENGIINMVNLLSGDELSFDVCCMTEAGRMAKRLPQGCQLHVLGKSSGLDWSLPRKLKEVARGCKSRYLAHSQSWAFDLLMAGMFI